MFCEQISVRNGFALSHKIYILFLSAFIFSASPAFAKGVVEKCVDWLKTIEKPAPLPRPVKPSENKDYRRYLRALARNPGTLPPAAPFTNDVSAEDLKFSFFFWWYPGNVFGSLMVPRNEELAAHLLAGERIAEQMVPTAEERAAEAATRAEQPILAEESREPAAKPGAKPPAIHDPHEEHLETSPTKDAHAAQPAAAPAPSQAAADHSFTDSGPPPSSGTP
jgi:hypothetical protein